MSNKRQREWVWLEDDDAERLAKLGENFPHMNKAAILSSLASAALRACQAENFRALPSSFHTGHAPTDYRLNEPKAPGKLRK